MEYFSPFHLINNPENLNLKLEKRRILAEFSLSESAYLSVAGKELNHDDILKIFDSLDEGEDLGFHQRIFECKHLLNFLENNQFDYHLLKKEMIELNASEEFIEKISPYYAQVFGKRLHEAFKKRDDFSVKQLAQLPVFIGVMEEDAAYRPVERILKQYIEDLKHKLKNAYVYQWQQELKPYLGERVVKTLNALPRRYQRLIDQFGYEFSDYVYLMYKRRVRRPMVKILFNYKKLNCHIELRKNFENNYRILSERYPIEIPQTPAEKRKGNWTVAIILLIVIGVPMTFVGVITSKSSAREKIKITDIEVLDSVLMSCYGLSKDTKVILYHRYLKPVHDPNEFSFITIEMSPYLNLIDNKEFSNPIFDYPRKVANHNVKIMNQAETDIIFFFTRNHEILYHQYVYSRDTLHVNYKSMRSYVKGNENTGDIDVYALSGKNWEKKYPMNYKEKKDHGMFDSLSANYPGVVNLGLSFNFKDSLSAEGKVLAFKNIKLKAKGSFHQLDFYLTDTLVARPDSVVNMTTPRFRP